MKKQLIKSKRISVTSIFNFSCMALCLSLLTVVLTPYLMGSNEEQKFVSSINEDDFELSTEKSLDPKEWNEIRAVGHQMIDDMINYLSNVRERPVWQSVPESIKNQIKEPLPLNPMEFHEVYKSFKANVLPYPTGNIHPRFWGWVMGSGTADGMLADMLASGMNSHVSGYDQTPILIEDQVISWLTEAMKFPADSSGLLVSGGTMANILGITVARNTKAPFDIRKEGLQRVEKPFVLYCSTETHSWAQKACEFLGLGSNALRRIPVDHNFQIDIELLQEAIKKDRNAGAFPFCVIGTSGTVNTGATDNLVKLAEICKKENLWFHIDGAFGALAELSNKYRHLVAGQNLADSIAFDLHKWMHIPFEAGCVLIKDHKSHEDSFTVSPNYLKVIPRGIASKPMKYANLGLELSRGFKALKVWMSMKTHGINLYSELIEQNIEQAHYLAHLIKQNPKLELLAPVPLNVVCFRYIANDLEERNYNCNDFNQELLLRIQEKGIAIPSSTLIDGKFALRVAITNHRSHKEDFELLISSVLEIGHELEDNYPF